MKSCINLVALFLFIIQCSLSSCTVQKSITKKGEPLNKAIIVNSLKPGKTYKFWDKNKSFEKVKITSLDSVGVKGSIRYNGNLKPFGKTHEEILAATDKITVKKVEPVLTVFAIGIGTLVIITTINQAMNSISTSVF